MNSRSKTASSFCLLTIKLKRRHYLGTSLDKTAVIAIAVKHTPRSLEREYAKFLFKSATLAQCAYPLSVSEQAVVCTWVAGVRLDAVVVAIKLNFVRWQGGESGLWAPVERPARMFLTQVSFHWSLIELAGPFFITLCFWFSVPLVVALSLPFFLEDRLKLLVSHLKAEVFY